MKTIGYITSIIVVPIYATILNGWALTKLWSWFMVKTFELPALSVPAAIGLVLVVTYITGDFDKSNPETKDKSFGELMLISVVKVTSKAAFGLLFGVIVRHWL